MQAYMSVNVDTAPTAVSKFDSQIPSGYRNIDEAL